MRLAGGCRGAGPWRRSRLSLALAWSTRAGAGRATCSLSRKKRPQQGMARQGTWRGGGAEGLGRDSSEGLGWRGGPRTAEMAGTRRIWAAIGLSCQRGRGGFLCLLPTEGGSTARSSAWGCGTETTAATRTELRRGDADAEEAVEAGSEADGRRSTGRRGGPWRWGLASSASGKELRSGGKLHGVHGGADAGSGDGTRNLATPATQRWGTPRPVRQRHGEDSVLCSWFT